MNCPYCNGEMRKGFISAYNRLNWTPENETNRGATKWAKSPNSIVLAEYFLLGPATVTAYYCDQCKKIVIDVIEE